MEIFKLFGSILVDSSKAEESISKTEGKAEGLGTKLGKGIETAGKWGLAIGGAAIAAGSAMTGLALNTADAASGIDDSAQRAGVGAEEFQKYAYAAKLSGIETSTLESAMVKAQKSFADASEGGKTASEAFSRLGLDVSNMTSDGAFDAAVTALAGMKDETERNALANDIFGKSYAELAPLLNEGADGINKLKQEAVDMGAVMSNDTVASGAKLGDTIDSLKMAFDGAFNTIGTNFIPILIIVAEWIVQHMPEIQSTFNTVFGVINTVVSTAYTWFNTYLLPVLQTLFGWIQENMPAIQNIASTVFGVIFDIVSQLWHIFNDNLIPILQALWDFISPTFPLIQGVVEVTFGAIVATVQTVVNIFDAVTSAIKTALEWLTSWNDTDAKEKETVTTKKSKKTTVNGKHATGLAYVPFDGYVAELHEGERVLTKAANKNLSNGGTGDVIITGNQFTVREEADIKKIARELYILQRTKERGTAPA